MEKILLTIDREYWDDYDVKSKLIVGNITIYLDKKFNWFNRLMLKLLFGLRLEKIGGKDDEQRMEYIDS